MGALQRRVVVKKKMAEKKVLKEEVSEEGILAFENGKLSCFLTGILYWKYLKVVSSV